MRSTILVLFLMTITACNGGGGSVSPSPSPSPGASASPSSSPIVAGKAPSIVYDPITSLASETAFIKEGEKQANAVLASECFRSEVLKRNFQENQKLSSAEIYQKFVDASPYKVGIKTFYGSFAENKLYKTVGYEGNPIRMNRYFVQTATYVGSTSLHEAFGHGLGFTHSSPKMNPKSVPYQLNSIFELCAKQLGFKIAY